jgi:hypothetical protein
MRARFLKPTRASELAVRSAAVLRDALPDAGVARTRSWVGASGQRYLHTVYDLLTCPPLPEANYLLVTRDSQGRSRIVRIDQATSDAPTLNLARIRHQAASLGANEVHVHFLAQTAAQRTLVTCDLRVSAFGALAAEATTTNTAA